MSDFPTLRGVRAGYAMCGSFCTFARSFDALEKLLALGCDVTGIMSYNAYGLDTRFGAAETHRSRLQTLTGKPVIHDIPAAEPIGPKRMFDILVVAPCTGNTLAKLAAGIVDTIGLSKIILNIHIMYIKIGQRIRKSCTLTFKPLLFF